jgi:hypothetical protein
MQGAAIISMLHFDLQITVSFVHHVFLGSALGLAFGLATSFWLARIWLRPGEAGAAAAHHSKANNTCFSLKHTSTAQV